MKVIFLTKGLRTIVDDEDYDLLMQHKWHVMFLRPSFYAARQLPGGKALLMHRFLLNAKSGQYVDHLNRDSLDNRRSNIRIATRSQNNHNRVKGLHNKNGFRGISKAKDSNRWTAYIRADRQFHYLGCFLTAEKAAQAYDAAAITFHGEHAVTNFPADRLSHR